MFRNYLRTAYRNLIRFKGFSLINILGLSLSMAVCMLIIVVIMDQYTYDRWHRKADRIYRVQTENLKSKSSLNKYASTVYPLCRELKEHCPAVEDATVVFSAFMADGISGDSRIPVTGLYADPSFFRMFDFPLNHVPDTDLLSEPYTMVMKQDIAGKFFGREDPTGQFLDTDGGDRYKINGWIPQDKRKSHIQFDVLVSAATLQAREKGSEGLPVTENWDRFYSSYVYILLSPQGDVSQVNTFLDRLSEAHYTGNEKTRLRFYLQPLDRVVPGPILSNELGFFLPAVFILFLGGLALVIILSAAFNYTSLSVARSLLRAREVGIRKTLGAQRIQIILQFLSEALLVALVSMLLAMLVLQFLLPAFSGMKMMNMLEIRPEQNIRVYLVFVGFALFTGLVSGILPAWMMSGFRPVKVLKGIMNVRLFSRLTLRKILLVAQFTFSIVFVVSIILIYRQVNYMTNARMGFDREVVFSIHLNGQKLDKVRALYSRLPQVASISGASHIPGIGSVRTTKAYKPGEEESYLADCFYVDTGYIRTMGLELVAGHDFPPGMNTENEKFVILNESAAKSMNLGSPAEAPGQVILADDSTLLEIVGVIRDYKYAALFLPMRSMMLFVRPDKVNVAELRIHPGNALETKEILKKTWKELDPYHEMEGDFLDREIREYYRFFEDVLYTVGAAAFLALLIAALGMLGMATYAAQTRLKEIGIRKALGADTWSVVKLLSGSFLRLLLLAALLAAPIAYYANHLWLQYMSHHVGFGAGNILAGIGIILLTGMITISGQTWRAGKTRPADILKYE